MEENQQVKKGDLIAELDPSDYQVAVENAEASLASAEANAAAAKVNVPITSVNTGSNLRSANADVTGAHRIGVEGWCYALPELAPPTGRLIANLAGRTPLLDCKPRSIWQPAPFGLDERGRKVTLLLLWISVLVGAQPRKGKTFAARLLALYAALDPYVKLTVADGKDSPDWKKFRLVAHRFITGTQPTRDGHPVEMLLDALHEMDRLREEGLIGALGVTNFDAAHLELALADGVPLVSNQV